MDESNHSIADLSKQVNQENMRKIARNKGTWKSLGRTLAGSIEDPALQDEDVTKYGYKVEKAMPLDKVNKKVLGSWQQ
ncbi:hypothetical protein CYMTET_34466, partial [Cymbomonas tetramitiformis]